jgi:serine/threonine protein kinase
MHPGERLAGRFEILGEAARGGMGTVFRAHDRRDRRDVALKVLRVDAQGHGARFEREAAILAGLRHPNIVEYISHGATPDGLRYLVMEWVDGETLAHRLAHGELTTAAIVAMARQLCRALAALHDRGVVHRDVKPSNVMLARGDVSRVKLVDLGVARRTSEPTRLTRTGVMIGTAGYLAPEVVRGGSAIDGRADLFALGCVLYECFTGAPAFRGDSPLALCAKVLLHDPPPLRALDPRTPPALDALVSALLARRPDQRPAGAAAVERALAELGAIAGAPPPGDGTRPSPTATITGEQRRLCGILVARSDDDQPWAPPDLDEAAFTVELFDDGLAVVVAGELAVAARLGLAIGAAAPGARIVVAAGASHADCIDRCARGLADLEISTQGSDPHAGAGVWIERGAIDELAGAFQFAVRGRHARITGEVP